MSANKIYFPSYEEVFEQRREKLKKLLESQISIPGFPIPIIKGRLNTIVAPSHSGKTIYSIGLTLTLARAGKKVLYLSTEEGEEAFDMKISSIEYESCFKNFGTFYSSEFNKEKLTNLVKKASEEGYEYLVIDYLKKSMWEDYRSDHVVMEEMNTTLLGANEKLENKLGIFTFIQGNRDAFDVDKNAMKDLVGNEGKIALMIDGGLPAYRAADNLMMIRRENGGRKLIVAKSRFNHEHLGRIYNYDVNLVDFRISIQQDTGDLVDVKKTKNKRDL